MSEGPGDAIQLHLPRRHAGQALIGRQKKRFNVVSCGRRWGKTKFGLDEAVDDPHRGILAGKPVGWFAPSYKLLDEPWREAKAMLAPITSRVDAQKHRIETITGGSLDFWTLDGGDPGRGYKYGKAIIDEAAMCKDLSKVWLSAIRPTLSDLQGDAWFLSTPRGIDDFRELWLRGQKKEPTYDERWMSWQMPTSTNPHIRAEEIADAKRDYAGMPLLFMQEYLAEFIADQGLVFKLEWLNDEKPAPEKFTMLYSAWDIAMTEAALERGDYTVGVIVGQDALGRYWLIDLIRGRWNPSEAAEQMLRAAAKYKTVVNWYEGGPPGLAVEPWLRKRLTDRGDIQNWMMTSHSGRGDKVVRTFPLVAVMAGDSFYVPKGAKWLGNLRDELAAFPNGRHDDQVDALSLAFMELRMIKQSAPVAKEGDIPDPGRMTGDILEKFRKDLADETGTKKRKSPWARN